MYCQPQPFTGVLKVHLLPKPCTKCDAVKKRKEKFKNELIPFIETYGREMMNEFYAFWTELNHSKTRMRFENERTWELPKRLARWDKTNFKPIKNIACAKFPNYYDRAFEKNLDISEATKYASHLISLGWRQQKSYEGAVVGWIKP